MDALLDDVRQTCRVLRHNPGHTTIAVLTLAIGIGAVTTMFSVASAALLHPLPFERPDELVNVTKVTNGGERIWVSLPEFDDWRAGNRSFTALGGSTAFDFNLRGIRPETISATGVTDGYLDMLGARPHLGRLLAQTDHVLAAPRVVLLTYPFWQQRFAGDPAVVGTTIDLDGPGHLSESSGRYTVVGVLAPDFWHFYDRNRTHVILPLRASAAQMANRDNGLVERIVGRVTTTTPARAANELRDLAMRFDRGRDAVTSDYSIRVSPLDEAHFGSMRPSLWLMAAATLVVALLACVNVALLFLARGHNRRQEMAVRVGLGASRGRLARLQFVESGIIAVAGASLGALAALWISRGLVTLVPGQMLNAIPGGAEAIGIDLASLVITAGITVAAAIGAGLLPAWRAARTDSAAILGATRGVVHGTRLRTERLLVVSEVALAVTLIAGAVLLLGSVTRLATVDLGITPSPGVVGWVNLSPSRYPDDQSRREFYDRLFDHLNANPRLAGATGIDMPFNLAWQTVPYATESTAVSDPARLPQALDRAVTVDYFARHGIELTRGRVIDDRDTASSSAVAVVSETMARRAWPEEDPVGRVLRLSGENGRESRVVTVVGVVADVRQSPRHEPLPIVYRPYTQKPPAWMYVTVVRPGSADALFEALKDAVASVDPTQPVDGPWTLAQWAQDASAQPALMARLASFFAGLAMLLAIVGIYGVLTHVVNRRVREFGVRMAIGASPIQIFIGATNDGVRMSAMGTAVGLGGALLLARSIEGMLFGVGTADAGVLAGVALLFGAVTWLTAAIPGIRAARVDPTIAMRGDL